MAKRVIKKILALPGIFTANKVVASLDDGDYLIGDVPYQCQFASPELTKDILEQRVDTKDDPNWKIFCFDTKEEYEYWSWRGCGVCCVKMALDYYGGSVPVAQLVDEGVLLGGYDTEKDVGWYYKPLLKLAEKYELRGFTSSYLRANELARHVIDKRFVIASVSPTIIRMDEHIPSKRKSGHLVLAVGVRVQRGKVLGFYINNPSGKTPEMRKNAYIPIKAFVAAYGERGIVLSR